MTKMAAVLGSAGAAVVLTSGAGIAKADPVEAAIATTCNYNQVMAALNTVDPLAAGQLGASPVAVSFLQRFLVSGPVERRQMANQVVAMPGAAQYVNDLAIVSSSCKGY